MIVVWTGNLGIILNQLRKRLFRTEKCKYSIQNQIKRIGVYYMCIDDLPL